MLWLTSNTVQHEIQRRSLIYIHGKKGEKTYQSPSFFSPLASGNLEQEYIIAEAIQMKSLTSLDLSSNKIDHSALALREYVASSRSAWGVAKTKSRA